ncbi:MAG TPA: 50S ribosomal protein L15 [Candidatus Latescibacteria bacterium]|nr:50S ribosomal protein L15 [Candidatus Latescibacterota bacterium]
MKLGELRYAEGTRGKRKRVGRGPGSGHGKRACRGQKGQRSRSGSKSRPGFEGGQTPIQRRLPKRGFTNIFRKQYQVVNLDDLSRKEIKGEVTPELLKQLGLIKRAKLPVKILGDGEIKNSIVVKAHAFSRSAAEKIERAGGKAEVI